MSLLQVSCYLNLAGKRRFKLILSSSEFKYWLKIFDIIHVFII
jgi:hypothetical protein